MTLCVYAVTCRIPRRIGGKGIAREPLQVVTSGPLSAIVGSVRRPPAATRDQLGRYAVVIDRLSHQVTSLLPARFGTCVSEEELTMILRSRRSSLQRSLSLVRNRVQMTVRVIEPGLGPRPSTPLRASRATVEGRDSRLGDGPITESPKSTANVTPPASGRAYLHARAADVARQRRVAGFEPLGRAVRRWVRGERVEKRLNVATVYHLIPRASVASYQRALQAAAGVAGLAIVVSGPFPPYAFAEI